jgi:hypothetical protein
MQQTSKDLVFIDKSATFMGEKAKESGAVLRPLPISSEKRP